MGACIAAMVHNVICNITVVNQYRASSYHISFIMATVFT